MAKFIVWNLNENVQQYEKYIKRCIDKTPYHLTEYLLAEEEAEEGQTKIFLYTDGVRFVLFPSIIRKINLLPYMSDLDEELYDMITPHEYGGIVSNTNDHSLKHILLRNILEYCNKNKIIYQFVRINPFFKELPEIYCTEEYEVIHSCAQVYVDLKQSKEQIEKDYKSNVRRNIRRAEGEGLKFEIAEKNESNIEKFQDLYQKAMDILKARRFLYFNERYFREMIKSNCSRLGFVYTKNEKIIAASILLLHQDTVYYHLGCFDRDYIFQRPMNYLMHSMIMWSKMNGYKIFHLGGGNKSLMQFKEGYSSTRINYFIAKKICDKDIYQKICEKWKGKFPQFANEKFYPQYRYNE